MQKLIKITFVSLISLLLLTGCLGGGSSDDIVSENGGETYQVSGQITNLKGDPVENVKISIDNQVDYTDANGLYKLEEVEGGNSYIKLESNNYRNSDNNININADIVLDLVAVENEVVYAAQKIGSNSNYFKLKRPGGTGWEYEIYLGTLDGVSYDKIISFAGGYYSITNEYTYFLAETDNEEIRYLMGIADRENIKITGLNETQFLNLEAEYKRLESGQPQIDFINQHIDEGKVYQGETVFFNKLEDEDLNYQFVAEGILNESNYGLVDGEWSLYRYGKRRFDPEISYTLNSNENSQEYNFVDSSGGVSNDGENGFSFALELLETYQDEPYYVYGWSNDSYLKLAVVEKTAASTEIFNNIYEDDVQKLRDKIEYQIDNSEDIIHDIFGEVRNP